MRSGRGVLDQKYVFEYDVGYWTYGELRVLKDRETGKLKACKTVPKASLRNPANVMAGLQRLVELQHPHISSITDALEDQQYFYIVSDFCQGGEVADWTERMEEGYWLQEAAVATYIRHTLMALTHSHSSQVFHRDLKPQNLALTSKLPDAAVKVTDFGLTSIIDPDLAILRGHPSPYTAPELLSGQYNPNSGDADLWSIGAIAHVLLLGRPPNATVRSGSQWLSRGRADDDGWSERSSAARDFCSSLLRPEGQRPTAAAALSHPWLKGIPLSGPGYRADNDEARTVRHKTLCYTLAVLLMPVLVPFRDFEQLRIAFTQSDDDRDGFVSKRRVHRVLLGRCALNEAVAAALAIADVGTTDVLDLCAAGVADLIAREFFAAGPTTAPLSGPLRATDLVPRMVAKFFEVFGDRQQQNPTVTSQGIMARLRTATARDVETHAGVNYEDIVGTLPESHSIDSQTLTSQLCSNAGVGTPLGAAGEETMVVRDGSSSNFFGLDVINMFQSCGVGAYKRDDSPHSVKIY